MGSEMCIRDRALGLQRSGLTEEQIREKVEATLRVCGLYPFRNWPVSALSFGQKKRVTIASILVMNPEILILDEPTSALDEKNASHFYRLLKKINAEKRITVLMVTHDLKRASSYADDIWVLEDGKVKQEAGKGDGQA